MARDTTTPITERANDPFGLVGVRLENKYDIEAVVAEGGFGVVYRAVHRALQKAVAVKVLKVPEALNESLRREFLEKFAQEARIVAQFEHPAIVRVLDFGASPMPRGESAPWVVLEWLHGITLEQDFASRRGSGRSPAEVWALLQPVMEALAYAHDEGVAHRDVKPGNVMLVANRRGEVSVKLLDFGVAKSMRRDEQASAGMTATRGALPAFSPLYAAPEQLSGARTGPWTDVHAMGLLLSEALVGAPVYTQDDATTLYAEVLSPTRPTPGKFGLDVGAWESVLQRALAIRPDRRFGHMRELLVALARALDDQTALYVAPARSEAMPLSPSVPPFGERVGRAGAVGREDVPSPSTFLPVTQAMARVEETPATSWKRVVAVVSVGVGVGVLAFGLGLGQTPTSNAPVAPLTRPAAMPSPVESPPSPPASVPSESPPRVVEAAPEAPSPVAPTVPTVRIATPPVRAARVLPVRTPLPLAAPVPAQPTPPPDREALSEPPPAAVPREPSIRAPRRALHHTEVPLQ